MSTSDSDFSDFEAQFIQLRDDLESNVFSPYHFIVEARINASIEDEKRAFVRDPFKEQSDALEEVDARTAHLILQELLRVTMAYNVEEMLVEQAVALASQFFALFGSDARYWSNTDGPHTGSNNGWTPLSTDAFDSGVLIIDVRHAGILWVEDKD